MPLSSDPEKRAAQLANLKPTSATKHGAYSDAAIRDLRREHLAELAAEFPSASRRELLILAHRIAQLDKLAEHADRYGVLRDKRRGEPFPAATLAEKLASSVERQIAALLERERTAGKPPAGDLDAHLAALSAASEEAA